MNMNISYELKLEIVNATKKRNEMFAKWIDLCSKIAFLLVLIVSLINSTPLKEYVFSDSDYLLDIVTIFMIVLSICFDFIFQPDIYKQNLAKMNEVLKSSLNENAFNQSFLENIDLIKEIDVARARYDMCNKLKVFNKLDEQMNEDKLQPIDIVIMNRQRYIIIALLLEIILLINIFAFMSTYTLVIYIIPILMIIVGVIFMIVEICSQKKAERTVKEIYQIKEVHYE